MTMALRDIVNTGWAESLRITEIIEHEALYVTIPTKLHAALDALCSHYDATKPCSSIIIQETANATYRHD